MNIVYLTLLTFPFANYFYNFSIIFIITDSLSLNFEKKAGNLKILTLYRTYCQAVRNKTLQISMSGYSNKPHLCGKQCSPSGLASLPTKSNIWPKILTPVLEQSCRLPCKTNHALMAGL